MLKIKCQYCKKETDVKITNVVIIKQTNLLGEDIYVLQIYYTTFCRNCGELLVGIKRKEINIQEILNLCK